MDSDAEIMAIDQCLHNGQNIRYSASKRLLETNKGLAMCKNLSNDSVKCVTLFRIANRFWNLKRIEEFRNVSQTALEIASRRNDSGAMAKGNLYLGDYFMQKRNFKEDSAQFYFLKARKLFENLHDSQSLAVTDLKISRNLYQIGDYVRAEKYALESLEFYRSTSDWNRIFNLYTMLGSISNKLYDNRRSIEFMEKALSLAKNRLYSKVLVATALNNLGRMYYDDGHVKIALRYYNDAINVPTSRSEDPELYAIILENLASAYSDLGRDTVVEAISLKAEKIRDSLGYARIKGRIDLANFYLKTGAKAKADLKVGEVIGIARTEGDASEKLETLKLTTLSNAMNSSAAKELIEIYDSTYSAENRSRNSFARMHYQTSEAIMEKDRAVRQKWFVLLISGLLVVIITLILINRSQKGKVKREILIRENQRINKEIYKLMLDEREKAELVKSREQNRIARDIHDSVMNKLAAIRLNLDVLNYRRDENTIMTSLSSIPEIQRVEQELRTLLKGLHQDKMEQEHFGNVVTNLVNDYSRLFKVEISIVILNDINWEQFSSEVRIHVYQIIQEILGNACKHSGASKIEINLRCSQNRTIIQVMDNGCGFDLSRISVGNGFRNIKFRVNEIKGEMELKSVPANGTCISFKF